MAHTLESWGQWLRASGYAQRTVTARIDVVRLAAERAGVAPSRLTRDHVVSLLAGREYAAWSRRTYLQHLTAWAEWTGRPEIVEGIRRPPSPPAQPDPLPEDDLRRLLEHLADDARTRAWVVLGAYAGLRAGEVARLSADQIHSRTLRVPGKGGRVDTLPLAPIVRDALAPWATASGPLWGLHPITISGTVRREAGQAGIRMRFHQLRHRFGTAVYRKTLDLLLTQRLMRHSKPQTTAGYAALVDEDGRQAVDNLPGATPGPHPKE